MHRINFDISTTQVYNCETVTVESENRPLPQTLSLHPVVIPLRFLPCYNSPCLERGHGSAFCSCRLFLHFLEFYDKGSDHICTVWFHSLSIFTSRISCITGIYNVPLSWGQRCPLCHCMCVIHLCWMCGFFPGFYYESAVDIVSKFLCPVYFIFSWEKCQEQKD